MQLFSTCPPELTPRDRTSAPSGAAPSRTEGEWRAQHPSSSHRRHSPPATSRPFSPSRAPWPMLAHRLCHLSEQPLGRMGGGRRSWGQWHLEPLGAVWARRALFSCPVTLTQKKVLLAVLKSPATIGHCNVLERSLGYSLDTSCLLSHTVRSLSNRGHCTVMKTTLPWSER